MDGWNDRCRFLASLNSFSILSAFESYKCIICTLKRSTLRKDEKAKLLKDAGIIN